MGRDLSAGYCLRYHHLSSSGLGFYHAEGGMIPPFDIQLRPDPHHHPHITRRAITISGRARRAGRVGGGVHGCSAAHHGVLLMCVNFVDCDGVVVG